MINKPLFIARLTAQEDGISGILTTAALRGNFVKVKADGATINDDDEMELADNSDGFYLSRDNTVEEFDARFLRASLMDRAGFVTPTRAGVEHAAAHRLIEGEFEGDDYLDVSLDASTAEKTPLCYKAGRLSAVTVAEEKVIGYVVKQLTPQDADTNGRRLLVHFDQ